MAHTSAPCANDERTGPSAQVPYPGTCGGPAPESGQCRPLAPGPLPTGHQRGRGAMRCIRHAMLVGGHSGRSLGQPPRHCAGIVRTVAGCACGKGLVRVRARTIQRAAGSRGAGRRMPAPGHRQRLRIRGECAAATALAGGRSLWQAQWVGSAYNRVAKQPVGRGGLRQQAGILLCGIGPVETCHQGKRGKCQPSKGRQIP